MATTQRGRWLHTPALLSVLPPGPPPSFSLRGSGAERPSALGHVRPTRRAGPAVRRAVAGRAGTITGGRPRGAHDLPTIPDQRGVEKGHVVFDGVRHRGGFTLAPPVRSVERVLQGLAIRLVGEAPQPDEVSVSASTPAYSILSPWP